MATRSAGRQRYQWGLLLLVAVLLVAWVFVDGTAQESDAGPGRRPLVVRLGVDRRPGDGTDPDSGLPTVRLADLPPEAARIVDLIDSGGPFDEDEDGSTFRNDEEILPDQPRGYYREYTVPTPGSDDRGARRIVGGRGRGALLDRRPLPLLLPDREVVDEWTGGPPGRARGTRRPPVARRVRRRRRTPHRRARRLGLRPRRRLDRGRQQGGLPRRRGGGAALPGPLRPELRRPRRLPARHRRRGRRGRAAVGRLGHAGARRREGVRGRARTCSGPGRSPSGACRSRCCCAARAPRSRGSPASTDERVRPCAASPPPRARSARRSRARRARLPAAPRRRGRRAGR